MKSKSVPLLLALILLFSVPVSADETSSTSVSYTHLRAHETR